jgi:four helix bundle protein
MKNKLTIVTNQQQPAQRRWQFDHHRLDAYHVAMQALVKGMAIVNKLPRGYGKLKDQAVRALQGAFTQTTEASARTGADRLARYRSARAEAGEAAGLLEAFEQLRIADAAEVDEALELLWRLCAMLCRLAKLKR